MSVTTFEGRVKILKMPPVLDPIQSEAGLTGEHPNVTSSASLN
jgi:hypothetical protein